jgi:hypothetical protein
MKRRSEKIQTWGRWALHLGMVCFLLVWFGQAWAASGAEPGMSFAEIMRRAGLAAGVVAIVWLLLTEFFIRPRWTSGVYLWALLFGMLAMRRAGLASGAPGSSRREPESVSRCSKPCSTDVTGAGGERGWRANSGHRPRLPRRTTSGLTMRAA